MVDKIYFSGPKLLVPETLPGSYVLIWFQLLNDELIYGIS